LRRSCLLLKRRAPQVYGHVTIVGQCYQTKLTEENTIEWISHIKPIYMKNLNAFLITACTLVIIACDKNEQLSQQLDTSVVKTKITAFVPPSVENLYGKYQLVLSTR
jgi:hypothetical protein